MQRWEAQENQALSVSWLQQELLGSAAVPAAQESSASRRLGMGRAPGQAGVGTERNTFCTSRKMLFVFKRPGVGGETHTERQRKTETDESERHKEKVGS